MKSHKFILRKYQEASVDVDWHPDETMGDVTARIEKMNMSEEEMGFGPPSYELVAISKCEGKISRIIWRTISELV